jgi:hypothetical protein
MAPLDAPVANAAVTYSDIETAHDGTPDDLFLILCFVAFRLHPAAKMRAALRRWNGYPFVHTPRNGAAPPLAIAATGFAAWALRIGYWCAARMRGGLTSAGAQRGFQFPPQPLRLLFQALDLLL